MGFKVKMGKKLPWKIIWLPSRWGCLRAEDLNDMFRDDWVDGIICLRGGVMALLGYWIY